MALSLALLQLALQKCSRLDPYLRDFSGSNYR
jgi:hypothetical protein